MISRLIKIGVLLVAAVLGYNYFFGDEAEKAHSREIVGKARDLGADAWDLLKSERQKMREGKYDGTLGRLGDLFGGLKDAAVRLKDSDALDQLRELDETREVLEKKLNSADEAEREEASREVDELAKATEELMKKLEAKE